MRHHHFQFYRRHFRLSSNTVLSREGNGGLTVTDSGKSIYVSDFFNNGVEITINGEKTSATTEINVDLHNVVSYVGTNYTEIFTGSCNSLTNVSAVDSVSNLLKSGGVLNDKNIEKSASEEIIVKDKNSKTIIVKNKHEESK